MIVVDWGNLKMYLRIPTETIEGKKKSIFHIYDFEKYKIRVSFQHIDIIRNEWKSHFFF